MMTKRYFISLCKMVIFMVVLMLIVASCQSHRVLQTERSHSDSITSLHIQYDSIYVGEYAMMERRADTVWVDRLRTEYRYRLLHDTICKTRTDSIPYEVHIMTAKEVPRPRNLFDYICYVCFGIIVVYLILKLKFRAP